MFNAVRLSVKLPKYIVIQNTRLACLEIVLQTVVIAGMIAFILHGKKYLTTVSPTAFPRVFSYVVDPQSAHAEDLGRPFCEEGVGEEFW